MKKRIVTTVVAVTLALLSVSTIVVMAQNGADATTEQFATRCERAQRNLQGPVRDSDIRTRVDRLQAYRYISKRMDIFTQRLEHNNQPDAKEMRAQVTQLDTSIDRFAADYETYDAMRDSLAQMPDCGKNPDLFQTRLGDVRQARTSLNQDVATIHSTLDTNFRNQLSDIVAKLEAEQQQAGVTQ